MLTTIRYIIITLFFAALSTSAYAACSSPAGVAGEHGYNETGTGQYEYCDGTDWIIMEETSANILGPTSGLIAYWRMDETTGSTIKDSVGSYDGTWIDTENSNVAEETEKGKYGRAIAFDDNDKMTTTLKIGTLPNKTYAGWFFVDENNPFWNVYLLQGDNYDSSKYVGLSGSDATEMLLLTQSHTSGTAAEYCGTNLNDPPTGQWFHFAGSIDKANNTMKIYVNGDLLKTCNSGSGVALSANTFYEPTLGVQVGAEGAGGSLGAALDGKADDLRIYNRTLSDAEVKSLFLATPSLDTGLVGHWQLNELMGNTAFDLSGDGHHGTFENIAPLTASITGAVDTALDLEASGANQRINMGDVLNLPTASPLTITAWIKPESLGSFNSILDNFAAAEGYRLYAYNNAGSGGGEIWYTQRDSGGTTDGFGTYTSPSGTIKTGEWQHVAVTYDGGSNGKLYVNGVEKNSKSTFVGNRAIGTANLYIGYAQNNTQYFDGGIDDVRLYDRSLSATEISKLFGLSAHYKMDEASGVVAVDSSDRGNDGTMSGGLSGTDTTTGKINTALDFDGTDDWIDVPPLLQPYMSATGSFTLATWFKMDGFLTNGDGSVPCLYAEGRDGDERVNVCIVESAGNYYSSIGWNGNPAGANSMWATTPLTEGEWYHIVVTKNGTFYEIYQNGVMENSGNHTRNPTGIIYGSIGKMERGTHSNYDYELDGQMDDFQVHAHALSAEDIFTLYSCSGPGVMDYNPYSHIYQWCDANYDSFDVSDTTGGGGGGCAASGSKIAGTEGAMQYDTTNDKMVYCGGSSWIDIPN